MLKALQKDLADKQEASDLLALADAFNEISALGEPERRACLQILKTFAEYRRSTAQAARMSGDPNLPAWSEQFTAQAIQQLTASGPMAEITPEWAWGGSTGKGIRVAVVDSGVEYDHPALDDCVRGGVVVEYDEEAENNVRIESGRPAF